MLGSPQQLRQGAAASTDTIVVPAKAETHIPREMFEARWLLPARTPHRPRRMGPGSAPRHACARHGLPGTTRREKRIHISNSQVQSTAWIRVRVLAATDARGF
ncbi:hypothetical protein BRAS3843_3280004 [Bradyrhizobium sp. STM 3843]|nr:hypothetical protein BRAS3843_3280004 [Bradyrhizobium sp. STM 3843]